MFYHRATNNFFDWAVLKALCTYKGVGKMVISKLSGWTKKVNSSVVGVRHGKNVYKVCLKVLLYT